MKRAILVLTLLLLFFANFAGATSSDKCTINLQIHGYGWGNFKRVYYVPLKADIYTTENVVKRGVSYAKFSVNPGKVTVQVKKRGYSNEIKTFDCHAGETITYDFQLTLNGCFLNVNVKHVSSFDPPPLSAISHDRLYIDGNRYGKNEVDGTYCMIVPLGKHKIEAYKFGYQSDEMEVACSENNAQLEGTLTLTKNKQECVPTVRMYSDTLQKNGKRPLISASLYVDEREVGTIKSRAIHFEAGKTYLLLAVKDGYLSQPQMFKCNAGERKAVNLILKRMSQKWSNSNTQ